MKDPGSALLLHSAINNNLVTTAYGHSGISISKDWVLTHGTALVPITKKCHAISDWITNIAPNELMLVPKQFENELNFRIYRELQVDDNPGSKGGIQEHSGNVVVAWKCPLLKNTFENFFESWSFSKSSKLDESLRSIFLLVKIDKSIHMEIPIALQVLYCLVNQVVGNPIRGLSVEIMSTPFGNPIFINSLAKGVISNIVGDKNCVIMTDAYAFPGSEGGPVYITHQNYKEKLLTGMVIAPLSWCRGEWVDYTFAANLAPCLFHILCIKKPDAIMDRVHGDINDKSVVLIRCGISWGTGIFVDKGTGTFLTCAHVVAGAPEREITVTMNSNKPNSRVCAKLLYKTPENQPYDVAVLRVDPKNVDPTLRPIKFSQAPILKGEEVISIGFSFFSSTQPTINSGVVSKSMSCFLLTTCCTQSGISGGPVINRKTGEMLGMVVSNTVTTDGTATYPRMSLAVPSTVLIGPLLKYLHTDNPDVLQAFTCNNPIVKKIWNLYPLLPSKI